MKHKKYKQREKFYAQREKCTTRTIQNWKRADAPLDDPDALGKWKACRQHLPGGTRDEQTAAAFKAVAKATLKQSTLPRGAASALKRLEDAEVNAFEALQAAMEAGEPLAIKLARKNWLEIGDALRRYELVVEANQRDAGELIARGEIERLLWTFGYLARLGYQDQCAPMATLLRLSADQFTMLRDHICGSRWLNCLATLAHGGLALPDWAIAALSADTKSFRGHDIPEWLKNRAELLRQLERAYLEHEIDLKTSLAQGQTTTVVPTLKAGQ